MGRLKIVLNLVILAIGAFIAWHEYHHPPATKPKPSPKPASPPRAALAPAPRPTAPPPAAPIPRPEREERLAPAPPVEAPAPAATPAADAGAETTTATSGDSGETGSAEESAAARISELTEEPAMPANAVPGDGSRDCPDAFPVKGNATSRIYHEPGRPSYDRTIAEFCFATVEAAEAAGFRAPRH